MLNTLQQLRNGELAGSRHIKLAEGLKDFPVDLFQLAETLEILDLSGNELSRLPDDLPRLHRLRIIFCSDNRFATLPAVLGQCPQLEMIGFKANQIRHVPAAALPPKLRWLILTDNQLEELPAELGNCSELQKLMLAGNRLRTLPASMANCRKLELVRIAANQLQALPDWLLSLPRLSWLAFAGNPFCPTAAMPQGSADIHWDTLEIQHKLGEGASGVIHHAEYQPAHWPAADKQSVAVKLFKGEVTSDGLPANEMAACLTAGTHPHLIPVLGRIEEHPEETHALVMSLIDTRFRNLAGPPSLDSCTRDIYAPETRFDLETVRRLALGIASAAEHLHAQGILHGDLYGHNILHCDAGHALLGDFGAASFVDRSNPSQASQLEQIEVRAFACLLEELLTHCPPGLVKSAEQTSRQTMIELKTACLQENIAARPPFSDIVRRLQQLEQAA
jgi:hypothetical protein